MLDHIGLTVSDFARARAFYDAALAPLGVAMVMEVTPEQTGGSSHLGYGSDGKPYFWIGGQGPTWSRDQGTDYAAVEEGFVSLTPLIVDLTHYGLHQEMKGLERDGLPPAPGDDAR